MDNASEAVAEAGIMMFGLTTHPPAALALCCERTAAPEKLASGRWLATPAKNASSSMEGNLAKFVWCAHDVVGEPTPFLW